MNDALSVAGPSAPEDNGSAEQPERLHRGDPGYVAMRAQELGISADNQYLQYAQQIEAMSLATLDDARSSAAEFPSPHNDADIVNQAKLELARNISRSIPDILKVALVTDRLAKGEPLKISYPDELNATGYNSG